MLTFFLLAIIIVWLDTQVAQILTVTYSNSTNVYENVTFKQLASDDKNLFQFVQVKSDLVLIWQL